MSTHHNGEKIGTLATPTHQEVQIVSCTVCRKVKGTAKVEVSTGICYNCGKSGHSVKFCYAKGRRAKGKEKKGYNKGWNDSKGWTVGKGWSDSKGWEQQWPAGMNKLERDS